jgi:hypothetical protein
MNICIDYPAMKAEVTLDTGEELSIARLDLTVHRIALDPVGVWNVELILPAVERNLHAEDLAQMGFVPAGNLTSGAVTSIRLRKSLRRSGDGHAAGGINGDLSTGLSPVKEPTQDERSAIGQLEARLAREHSGIADRVAVIERQAQELRRMREQPIEGPKQSPEIANYIDDKYRKDSGDILDRIKQLQRTPEVA